jgi:hypothetical protein
MNENLQERVHALVRGECSAAQFLQELPALCDAAPDAAWDALALIDQYHRRGKLSAELFQTLRQRIERHALGVPDWQALSTESAPKRASEGYGGAPQRSFTAMRRRAGERRQLAEDVRALRLELLGAHTKLQRYRRRIRVLADYGRRKRAALIALQRDLTSAHSSHGLERRERMKWDHWRRAWRRPIQLKAPFALDFLRARWHWSIRSSQIAVVAALLLGVGASRALQDVPEHHRPPPPPPRIVAPPAAPAVIEEPGELSLSAARYVVLPGHTNVEIEVQRTRGAGGDVSFRWWTQGSGARPGRDYVSVSSKLARVPDGVDTLRLSVPILRNPERRHTELFYVAIEKPSGGASLGSIRRATIFIVPP